MHLPLNTIVHGNNAAVLPTFPDESVDLTLTSPPYDDMRDYGNTWSFPAVALNLVRIIKPGGILVWVVGDGTVDGSETGTSFRQALGFMDLGFRLHDTMIYEKSGTTHSEKVRYHQVFEYMFVLSKGRPKTTNILKDRKNKYVLDRADEYAPRGEYGARFNVWRYANGGGHIGNIAKSDHPAPFPEALARDHILSWSNAGDVVLDPFMGSGTTAKICVETGRAYIGIEENADWCAFARARIDKEIVKPKLGFFQ